METKDDLDDYIDRLLNKELQRLLVEEMGPYTCQFLKQDTVKGLVPFASGVLVHLGDAHYILTASHVIEDWSDNNKLFVEIKGGHVSIVGKGCGTEIDKEQKIDTAYIKLKPEIVPVLAKWYRFLPIERCLFPDKVFHEPNYCVYGFPVANPVNENGRTIGAGYFLRPHPDKVFEHYGFDPMCHYVLEFRGKAVNIKTHKPEKIKVEHYGLSGGGLWYTVIDHDGDKFISAAYLIGIMTEFRHGKYDSLIGNRIEKILAAVYQNEGFEVSETLAELKEGPAHPIYDFKAGNWLWDTTKNTYCVAKTVRPCLTVEGIDDVVYEPKRESIDPIPISLDHLAQAKFRPTESYYCRDVEGGICDVVPFPGNKFGWFVNEDFVIEIEYLHELQNCFFATIDKHLELNLWNMG